MMKESLGHTFSGDEALWHACLQQSELHGGQMKYAFHFKADVGAVSHVVSGSVLKSGLLPPASLRFPASMWIRGSLAWGYPCVGSPSLLSPSCFEEHHSSNAPSPEAQCLPVPAAGSSFFQNPQNRLHHTPYRWGQMP